MKTAIEILTKEWNEKYNTQPYETHHLHYNYEDLVLKAMERFAEQEAKEFGKWFVGDSNKEIKIDFDKLYKEFKNENRD